MTGNEFDVPDTLDLSGMTKKEAAEALASHLREHYANNDGDVLLWSPEKTEAKRGRRVWTVSWESGSPFEWAMCLTGGRSIYSAEMGSSGGSPQAKGFDSGEFGVNCPNTFTIEFFDK